VRRLSREALERLQAHAWPGNVRELQHVVERMVVLGRGEEAGVGDLPPTVLEEPRGGGMTFRGEVIPARELQRRYAAWALDQMGGHRGRTAERLGVDAKTLAKWLAEPAPPRAATAGDDPAKP
jgi:two-component system response regulator HydG